MLGGQFFGGSFTPKTRHFLDGHGMLSFTLLLLRHLVVPLELPDCAVRPFLPCIVSKRRWLAVGGMHRSYGPARTAVDTVNKWRSQTTDRQPASQVRARTASADALASGAGDGPGKRAYRSPLSRWMRVLRFPEWFEDRRRPQACASPKNGAVYVGMLAERFRQRPIVGGQCSTRFAWSASALDCQGKETATWMLS